MLFSYKFLQSFFEKKLPSPKRLAELLTAHIFEVGEIEKMEKDYVLDVEILPNRGDCLSHLGLAREISAILNLKLKAPKIKIKETKEKIGKFVSLEVKDKACKRYTARLIRGVKVSHSPLWLKERLEICGINSINNVVDILNYVMLELGQPLHSFDFDKISLPKKIIVRNAKEGEEIVSLDGKRYKLDREILLIADSKKPLAIAGIKGGKEAEIKKETKNILIESANFEGPKIRKACRKLELMTEASKRFEHQIDPNLTEIALERACQLIQEICGGEVLKGKLDFYLEKEGPKVVVLNLEDLREILGIQISQKEVKRILNSLGFKFKKGKEGLKVKVPTFRRDISLPEDLIEEVGRIVGYEKIPVEFPRVFLVPPKRNLEIFWQEMVRDILKEMGFCEVYNYSFLSKREIGIFDFLPSEVIEVENPTSEKFQFLRPSLIPNLLKNIKKNLPYFKEIKIFEIGKTFKKKNSQKILEKKMLSGAIFGERFFEAKGTVEVLLNKLGIPNVWFDEYQAFPTQTKISIWHPKRCAEIKINQTKIGFLGEICGDILEKYEIFGKVTFFDIDFEKLSKLASEEHEYQPISPYPAIIRDIAILVPKKVKVIEVLNVINSVGKELIRDVDLFDIYEDKELSEGKKSLAFRIVYQAKDRALSSKEVEKVQERIIEALERNPEWEVRR